MISQFMNYIANEIIHMFIVETQSHVLIKALHGRSVMPRFDQHIDICEFLASDEC